MPASRVNRIHFSISVCISRANSSGLLPRGLEALLREEFFDLGCFKRFHDGLVELVDDQPRRVGRREHTVPSRYFVASEASFRDRWYLRRDREPLAGTDA